MTDTKGAEKLKCETSHYNHDYIIDHVDLFCLLRLEVESELKNKQVILFLYQQNVFKDLLTKVLILLQVISIYMPMSFIQIRFSCNQNIGTHLN